MSVGQDGDSLVFSGRKCFVTDFRNAAHCLVAVRMAGAAPHSDVALVLVDTDAPGIQVEPLRPLAKDQECFRSEEHTSELQSLMRISYAVFCLKKKTTLSTTNI